MKEHRENLLKLIKMIMVIKEEQERHNADNDSIQKSKLDTYIYEGNLLSLRELSKMFIEELKSEELKCEKDDEIVYFIKNMSVWFSRVYDAVIENKRTLDVDIKTMKICNQLKKDYDNIYSDAEMKHVSKNGERFSLHHFSFGKKPKEQQYTSNTVQPITINLTFTGDSKENEITAEKLKNMIDKYSKDNGRRFI